MNPHLANLIPLAGREKEAIREFITRLEAVCAEDLYGVVLYGSKVRNEATPESDIDLLLIMQNDDWPNRDNVTRIAAQISLAFDWLLSAHVASLSHWQVMRHDPFVFYQHLFAEGIPLFGSPELFTAFTGHETTAREIA